MPRLIEESKREGWASSSFFVDGTYGRGKKMAMQAMRDRTIADFTLSVFSEIVSISNQRGFFRSPHCNNLELGRPWMMERVFV